MGREDGERADEHQTGEGHGVRPPGRLLPAQHGQLAGGDEQRVDGVQHAEQAVGGGAGDRVGSEVTTSGHQSMIEVEPNFKSRATPERAG